MPASRAIQPIRGVLLCSTHSPFARLIYFALASLASLLTAAEPQSVRLRIIWGGGEPAVWRGAIVLPEGQVRDLTPLGSELYRDSAQLTSHGVEIKSQLPADRDEFDVTLTGDPDAKLQIEFQGAGQPQRWEPRLGDLEQQAFDQPLDERGNRLLIQRVPNDAVRVSTDRPQLVFAPAEEFVFTASFAHREIAPGTAIDVQVDLLRGRGGEVAWSSGAQRVAAPIEDLPEYTAKIPLPTAEGVYSLRIKAIRPAGFAEGFLRRGASPVIAERTIQLVVLDSVAAATHISEWKPVLEIDPAAPRWWERLPKWAGVKRLPILNAGHLAPGPLGSSPATVLAGGIVELPPRNPQGEAAWQGYQLPVARAGEPYLVELELPRGADQLGISLFDTSASGHTTPLGVGALLASSSDVAGDRATPRTIRKLFWPLTTSPLLVVSNAHPTAAVQFGKIRVLSGVTSAVRRPAAKSERILALNLENRDLAAVFNASRGFAPTEGGGYEFNDWQTAWEIAQRLADAVELSGHNSAVVTVAGPEGAHYPSQALPSHARRDNSAWASGMIDAGEKDLLALLLHEFDRRGLTLTPAVRLRSSAATPNFSRAETRRWQAALAELQQRCAGHSSVRGLAVSLELPTTPAGAPRAERFYRDLLTQWQPSDSDPLLVLTQHLFSEKNLRSQLQPRPEQKTSWRAVLKSAGAPLEILASNHAVQLVEPLLVAAATPLNEAALANSLELGPPVEKVSPALNVTAPTTLLKLANTSDRPPAVIRLALESQELFARELSAVATADPHRVLTGGDPALIINEEHSQLRQVLAKLAPDSRVKPTTQQPVTVRTFQDQTGVHFLVLNRSAWRLDAGLTITAKEACRSSNLLDNSSTEPLEAWQAGQHVLELKLPPLGAKLVSFDNPFVTASGVRVRIPARATEELQARLAALDKLDLTRPKAFETLVDPSFESASSAAQWSLAANSEGAAVEVSTEAPLDGQQCLRFASAEAGAKLVSRPFAAPVTGQLAVVFRIYVRTAAPGAKLVVRLQSTMGGYQQFTSAPLETQAAGWQDFAFPVDDVPLDSGASLELAFELTGSADVQLDRVETFDLLTPLAFDANDATRRKLAFIQELQVAKAALAEGRTLDCLTALDSYGLRFYGAYAPERIAEPVIAPAPLPPPPAEEKLEFTERVKRYLPSFMR